MTPSVGITNKAADQAAAALGWTPVQAKAFLERQVRTAGRVATSDQLPVPHTGMRSKTGEFVVIMVRFVRPGESEMPDPAHARPK